MMLGFYSLNRATTIIEPVFTSDVIAGFFRTLQGGDLERINSTFPFREEGFKFRTNLADDELQLTQAVLGSVSYELVRQGDNTTGILWWRGKTFWGLVCLTLPNFDKITTELQQSNGPSQFVDLSKVLTLLKNPDSPRLVYLLEMYIEFDKTIERFVFTEATENEVLYKVLIADTEQFVKVWEQLKSGGSVSENDLMFYNAAPVQENLCK
jgi:hypothetical protein